ncbi:ovarian cancer G-protein coupled receptor 1-like [Chiloscyllium plagiosum]|uniref:ovarian cancer G-protein coupled receptor 1-like n=1 Tax=Chiloscyllium plagiosum TaxID=36176 RepID=UPI001CB7B998|nr:ovarian cancer G-protein coupled receptor 1-like [Chiloscyllium plagiosum]
MSERTTTTTNSIEILYKNDTCTIQYSFDQWLFSIVYVLVFILGLPINCIALYAAYKQVRRKNELGIYLFNLTVADLLYILTLPFWIDFTLHDDNWRAGATMCQICSFLTHTNLYASSAFLCCISFDRYLGVVHPLRTTRFRTIRTAITISCVAWLSQSAFNLELLIQPEISNNSKSHKLCYDIYPIEPWKANLNYFRIAFGFLLPFALIFIFYCSIYNSVSNSISTLHHEKRRAVKLMLSITVGFTICFFPYHAMLLVRSIMEKDCNVVQHIFIPYRLSVALICLNCILDPILYCFVNETARRDILLATLRRKENAIRTRKLQANNMSETVIL